MKASLKLREEQKPQIKAKLPLSILSFPFQSTISTGDSKELCLSLGTHFECGPSFRFSYRPNDDFNPFSFMIKTGIGHLGSPVDAPMTISAQFNFPNYHSTPGFFLHFKPRFGDFVIRKTHKSDVNVFDLKKGGGGGVFEDGSVEFVDRGEGGGITDLPLRNSVEEAVSGMELGAKTVLPITNGAVLKLRWGVKLPQGFNDVFNNESNVWTAGIWPRRMMPVLGLNKISIEHVAKADRKKQVGAGTTGDVAKLDGKKQVGVGTTGDVAESWLAVKRQLEMLRSENATLGKAVADLRADAGWKGKGKGHVGERKLTGSGDVSNCGTSADDVSKA